MRVTLALCTLVAVARGWTGSNDVGAKLLDDNRHSGGIHTLPSGLQFKILQEGEGKFHPKADTPCEVHYEGRTAQNYPGGEVFDSSYARGTPSTFAPNQVIKGWTEAMQLMVEGDKWEMYIPGDLGYGDKGRPPKIGGGDVLVFTMEILKIKGDTVPVCDPWHEDLIGCNENDKKFITAHNMIDTMGMDDDKKFHAAHWMNQVNPTNKRLLAKMEKKRLEKDEL